MKVYLSADIEGTCGIIDWNETERSMPNDYDIYRHQMEREVAAACRGALKAGVSVIACLLLTGVVFYQNKAQKKLPLAFWIVLAALCLISSNRGVNLTLLAMIVWFSPKFAFMDKQVHAPVAPETTAKGVLEDKLAMLENLQMLLMDGTISKEEFDAKKKEILGL